jgi:hypothetical protein
VELIVAFPLPKKELMLLLRAADKPKYQDEQIASLHSLAA